MKKIAIILFLALFMFPQTLRARVLITSIPKAGTHLICKTIEAITHTPVQDTDIHHTYDRIVEFAKANPDIPILLIVRDLRDVCLSYVNYVSLQINRHPEPKYYYLFGEFKRSDEVLATLIPMWQKMSVEEKLTAVLEANDLAPCDIDNFFRVAVELSTLPNVTLIRFENLVGSKGGGDFEQQCQEIEKIASVYNISLHPQHTQMIAHGLFGTTPHSRWNNTFKRGQIGSWKEVYTPNQISTFKERFNDYLYYFGYIENENWE
ncbi:MAG: hypothetical protein KDK64_06055 [Chlamydiia bacterium]|nr:hypothetical protein [Chlamydiia bacterium]